MVLCTEDTKLTGKKIRKNPNINTSLSNYQVNYQMNYNDKNGITPHVNLYYIINVLYQKSQVLCFWYQNGVEIQRLSAKTIMKQTEKTSVFRVCSIALTS